MQPVRQNLSTSLHHMTRDALLKRLFDQPQERNRMEDEVRRQEVKRKTAPGGRKPKRRKLEKLVG